MAENDRTSKRDRRKGYLALEIAVLRLERDMLEDRMLDDEITVTDMFDCSADRDALDAKIAARRRLIGAR